MFRSKGTFFKSTKQRESGENQSHLKLKFRLQKRYSVFLRMSRHSVLHNYVITVLIMHCIHYMTVGCGDFPSMCEGVKSLVISASR